MDRLDKVREVCRTVRMISGPNRSSPMTDEVEWAVKEIEQLRAGYHWLEGLAEGRQIVISIDPIDGTLEISNGIHALFQHIDLADLCVREAAQSTET